MPCSAATARIYRLQCIALFRFVIQRAPLVLPFLHHRCEPVGKRRQQMSASAHTTFIAPRSAELWQISFASDSTVGRTKTANRKKSRDRMQLAKNRRKSFFASLFFCSLLNASVEFYKGNGVQISKLMSSIFDARKKSNNNTDRVSVYFTTRTHTHTHGSSIHSIQLNHQKSSKMPTSTRVNHKLLLFCCRKCATLSFVNTNL